MTGPLTSTIYGTVRDEIAREIGAGVYPAGALLPSIREIMQRWEVSTTTARRVLDELAAAGYARKEGTRGHISTGGPASAVPQAADLGPARQATFPPATSGRLTIRPAVTIPAGSAIAPDDRTRIAGLDVRPELAPPDAALALRLGDPEQGGEVIVRRCLLAASDGTPVQLRTSYIPSPTAEGTPLAQPEPAGEPWQAALAEHTGRHIRLSASHITARHPHSDEAAALALPPDAAVLVRTDIHHDEHGTPIDYTRTVWPGDTTRLTAPA
jgi:DNA-binding GntR family transcriptional regulator